MGLTLLSLTLRIPFDPTFSVLPLVPTLRRTFALSIFVVMGIIRDGLFTTLPWYSSLLLTFAVILIYRSSFSWLLVGIVAFAFYLVDVILRVFWWKANFSPVPVVITTLIIFLMSYVQERFLSS